MYKFVSFFFFLCFWETDADCAQRIVTGSRFKSLDRQGIVYLGQYLDQIEYISKQHLFEKQVKLIVKQFDSSELRVLSKNELLESRKDFYRNRVKIAADWSYFTRQRIPNLLNCPEEIPWDLHHIIFLRLNGQNDWWNIIPLPRKEHRTIIHSKAQPGELLHNHLAARFSKWLVSSESFDSVSDFVSVPEYDSGL